MKLVRPELYEVNEIFELFTSCNNDMIRQGIDQWDDQYPNIDLINEDLCKQSIYIMKDQEKIVGVISFDDEQSPEYLSIAWSNKENMVLVIHRLAVQPLFQGKGIAKKLMEYAEIYAANEGYSSIRLDAFSGNEKSLNFYKKLNYQIRGEVYFPRRIFPFYCFEKNI